MSREALGNALAGVLNRAVALDPEARRSLRKLEGRTVGVHLIGPEISAILSVQAGVFELGGPDSAEPDAWVRASPGTLLAMAASKGAVAGQVEISGDAETGRRFQKFFSELRPDLEEAFARVLGDVAGVHAWRLVSAGMQLARRTGESLRYSASAYLREETRQLVSAEEMEDFLNEVDELRDSVARLEARLKRSGRLK